MGLELVIFDMDGLMFNTEEVAFMGWSQVIRDMGCEPLLELFSRSLGGHEPDIVVHYEKLFKRKTDLLEIGEIFKKSFRIFDEIVNEQGIKIKHGLLELLEELQQKGVKKAIASSSSAKIIERYLKETGVSPDIFEAITSGDMVANLKPDPEIFIKTCERLNVKPENALVLEDSRNGLKAACSARIKCVIIPDLSKPDDEIIQKAFRIANNLLEVIDIVHTLL